MSLTASRSAALAAAIATTLFVFVPSSALAQVAGHEWHKSYPLSGKPLLTLETADSRLDIQSCGDCKEVRIQVQSGRDLNEYILEEHQDGDHVSFSLKEKPHTWIGFHANWKTEGAKVTVETPAHLELHAKTADGDLSASQLSGELEVRSGDGSVTLDDVHGNLRLASSDGNVNIQGATGTIEARAADGHMKIDGQFTGVQLRTSDGNLDFSLAPGSQLTSASRIESSDGHVSIRLPKELAADVDVTAGDGHVDCSLPLSMDHYDSNESSGHHMHGRLNAGSTPLSIHTSDGNVTIAAI